MFYEFRQNNSGGVLVDNLLSVIVEADSAEAANEFAESHTPVYFNGCEDGMDCPCCGDRWYAQYSGYERGTKKPAMYGETDQNKWETSIWKAGTVEVRIYYKNGTIESVWPGRCGMPSQKDQAVAVRRKKVTKKSPTRKKTVKKTKKKT